MEGDCDAPQGSLKITNKDSTPAPYACQTEVESPKSGKTIRVNNLSPKQVLLRRPLNVILPNVRVWTNLKLLCFGHKQYQMLY